MRHPDKVRENRLRRAAIRQGLQLHKSRTRDPRGIDYGRYGIARDGAWIAGASNHLSMSLDEVEHYLAGDTAPAR